jgi:hypothetical protein
MGTSSSFQLEASRIGYDPGKKGSMRKNEEGRIRQLGNGSGWGKRGMAYSRCGDFRE